MVTVLPGAEAAAETGLARLWQAPDAASGSLGARWLAALDAAVAARPRPVAAAPLSVSADAPMPAGLVRLSDLTPAITRAAARTGIAPDAVRAVIGAEAGRVAGRLDPAAANPRSSARGLGQFLSQTWLGEAARPGTHLNRVAAQQGWLDAGGRVLASARDALLALRSDPGHAVEAVADFAARNLASLRSAAAARPDLGAAQLAWLGHHLGAADATAYLKGALSDARAATLLAAQIGSAAANARIAAAGSAAAAHRGWLEGYLRRHIG
jgi:hypothetical protein